MPLLPPESGYDFKSPFDPGSESPTIDHEAGMLGINYDPKTGTFSFRGQGGGSGGGGSVLPSRSIPGMHTAVPGAIGSQGVSAGLGAAAAGGAGAGLGALGGGAAGAAGGALGGLDWKDLLALIMGGAGALGGAFQGPPQAEGELNDILKIAKSRIGAQEPLFKAFTTMAHAQLPKYSREGQ